MPITPYEDFFMKLKDIQIKTGEKRKIKFGNHVYEEDIDQEKIRKLTCNVDILRKLYIRPFGTKGEIEDMLLIIDAYKNHIMLKDNNSDIFNFLRSKIKEKHLIKKIKDYLFEEPLIIKEWGSRYGGQYWKVVGGNLDKKVNRYRSYPGKYCMKLGLGDSEWDLKQDIFIKADELRCIKCDKGGFALYIRLYNNNDFDLYGYDTFVYMCPECFIDHPLQRKCSEYCRDLKRYGGKNGKLCRGCYYDYDHYAETSDDYKPITYPE